MAMFIHLLLYRSLTRAQRASAALDREGIPNRLIRAPKAVSGEGCSQALQLNQGYLHRALTVLKPLGIEPKRVFLSAGDEQYKEVHF